MSNPYCTVESDAFSLPEVGRPTMAVPGMSATYHFVWICLGFGLFPGLHISRHLSTPYCEIYIPLYAVTLVVLVSNPVGSPFRFICLGYSLSNTLRCMTLSPAPVSTFTQTEALVLPSQSAERCTMVYASVFLGLLMSSIMISSGSLTISG